MNPESQRRQEGHGRPVAGPSHRSQSSEGAQATAPWDARCLVPNCLCNSWTWTSAALGSSGLDDPGLILGKLFDDEEFQKHSRADTVADHAMTLWRGIGFRGGSLRTL